ncbi:hypothetical protein AAMO2058_001369400 [Amorphochlora amoebiformis]
MGSSLQSGCSNGRERDDDESDDEPEEAPTFCEDMPMPEKTTSQRDVCVISISKPQNLRSVLKKSKATPSTVDMATLVKKEEAKTNSTLESIDGDRPNTKKVVSFSMQGDGAGSVVSDATHSTTGPSDRKPKPKPKPEKSKRKSTALGRALAGH